MSSAERNSSEKRILEEDCAEDTLKNGILTLTNKRLLFRKTEGKMATLSKKTGDIILNLNLNQIRFSKIRRSRYKESCSILQWRDVQIWSI